ncbi:MAG: hypothetical protein HPY57_00010 [Ignavibacteria bacterium]|nr:hypothetical protein [Ignavibacteria bacterium]
MKDKLLNFLLFLHKELEGEEDKIKADFLKRGINLEEERQKLLDEIKKYIAQSKRDDAYNFKTAFNEFMKSSFNLINEDKLDEIGELAIQFRRNNKKIYYDLTTEDKKKLKFIADYRRKQRSEENKEKIDNP